MGTAVSARWNRVVVVGNSGSGKTTFALRLAQALDLTHVELDSIYHQPGWTPLDAEEVSGASASWSAVESARFSHRSRAPMSSANSGPIYALATAEPAAVPVNAVLWFDDENAALT
jgi:cytidylate kinase